MNKVGFIDAGRLRAGASGATKGWNGVDDFINYYVKNLSATSEKAAHKLFVTNNAARTAGRLNGLIVEVEGKAAVDLYGARGANISLYIPSDAPVSGGQINCGLHVEAQGGQSITGDWYAAYIYNCPGAQPSGSNGVLRLESNVSADNRNEAWIHFVGGKGSYAMSFGPLATQTAWAYTGSLSSQTGWIKVKVATADRYIPLYSS
jgi:hypothetical protein